MSKIIEVEGSEIALRNKAGDVVIIPKKYRLEVEGMIKEGCHGCIDNLVETLPVMSDYAEDGNLIPRKYTASKDNLTVNNDIRPLETFNSNKLVQPDIPVLRADTRTDTERKIDKDYTDKVLNPSINQQIAEGLQKPLRWVADPVKGVGDIISAVAPKSALAQDLPNTSEDSFEYRKKQLNPYTSGKEKVVNTINESLPLTTMATLNSLPIEAVGGNMLKAGKKVVKNSYTKFSDFKNDNEFFRIIVGDDAFNDIVSSGKVRTNYGHKPKTTSGIDLSNRGTLYPSFSKGSPSLEYAGANPEHYIIRTSDNSIKPSTVGRHGKGTTMFPTDEFGKHLSELDASKVSVYKHIGDGNYEIVLNPSKITKSKK